MKALSIRQPYAYAITMGLKPVENRSWPTNFRGPVLIHAGLKEETHDVEDVLQQIALQCRSDIATERASYERYRFLGGIVGCATIRDCVDHHPGPWFNGPFGFVLAHATPSNFVPCRGALGFFTVPNDVLAKVVAPPYLNPPEMRK